MSDEKQVDYLGKVAEMRDRGLPFDLVVALFVDPQRTADELAIRAIIGEPPNEIYIIAILVLAYYHPEYIGLDKKEDDLSD